MSDVRTFAVDLVERAGSTFLQAAAPVLLAANSVTDWNEAKALAVSAAAAGGAAVLSLLKGVLAGVRTGTASVSSAVAETSVPARRPQPGVTYPTEKG